MAAAFGDLGFAGRQIPVEAADPAQLLRQPQPLLARAERRIGVHVVFGAGDVGRHSLQEVELAFAKAAGPAPAKAKPAACAISHLERTTGEGMEAGLPQICRASVICSLARGRTEVRSVGKG